MTPHERYIQDVTHGDGVFCRICWAGGDHYPYDAWGEGYEDPDAFLSQSEIDERNEAFAF